MKRILVILYYYYPYVSGLSEYARRLSESLVREGYEVTVLSTRFDDSVPERQTINGVDVVRAPVWMKLGKGVISPAFVRYAIRLSRSHDIIHVHLPLAEAGLMAPFFDSSRLVATYHCDINLGGGLLNRLIEKVSYVLMGLFLRRARVIIGNSSAYFDSCRFRRHGHKFVQIYPPIETQQYLRAVDPEFLDRIDVARDTFKIGFVGRIVYEKGLNFLFEAIPYLEQVIPDFQILVVGDADVAGGGVLKDLDQYISQYASRINFVGKLSPDDLVRFYSNIDVLALPSIDPLESFGMVQVEAMCCGTPVVASNMPGVNEVVSKTGFGHLSEPRDAKDLAEQLIKIYATPLPEHQFHKVEWDISETVSRYAGVFGGVA